MGLMLKMAYANLWRRRSRTIVVIVMIAMGIAGLMFMQGFYDGMLEGMKDAMIRTGSGHVMVENEAYKRSGLLKDSVNDPTRVLEILEADPAVRIVATKLVNEGMAASAQFSQGVKIVGIDAAREHEFGRLDAYIVAGEYGFGSKEKGVMLGASLADKMKVDVGKKIVLTTQAADKSISSAGLRVVGILKTENPYVDKQVVFVDMEMARKLFAVRDRVSYFTVMLYDEDRVESVSERLGEKIDGVNKVYSWREYNPMVHQFEQIMTQFYGIMYLVVFTVVAIGIFDIILISVLERVRELGIMMAIGTTFGKIRLLVMMESMVIGLLGFAAGAVVGTAVLAYFHTYGLDLSFAARGLESFGISSVIYAALKVDYFIWAFSAVVLATFLASLIPIRILRKRRPVEVIRFS